MQATISDQRNVQRRKFLLALPIPVLPFIIILFFVLGGGKKKDEIATASGHGVNMHLPDAHFKKEKQTGKLGLYEIAERDSVKMNQAIRNDPYYKKDTGHLLQKIAANAAPFRLSMDAGDDSTEKKLEEKLARLNDVINQKNNAVAPDYLHANLSDRAMKKTTPDNGRLDKIEQMIRHANPQATDNDPEMDRLEKMLDKIIAIQNPALYKADTINAGNSRASEKNMAVEKNKVADVVVPANGHAEGETKLFRNLVNDEGEAENSLLTSKSNSWEAVTAIPQRILPGDPVSMSIAETLKIGSVIVEKGSVIYGVSSMRDQRLLIHVSSIRTGRNIFPVSLDAFGADGLAGIFVPGSATRESLSQSGNQFIGSVSPGIFDPSLGAQAASAGIQAAKSLAGKKIRQQHVTIPAGYHLLLQDNSHQ